MLSENLRNFFFSSQVTKFNFKYAVCVIFIKKDTFTFEKFTFKKNLPLKRLPLKKNLPVKFKV